MAVTLLGYLENLILYQFGAYACFDLKTRMPWIQIAGAGMCALLFYVSDVPSSITSYGVMLCVVFFALKEEWRKRFWHLGVLFILVSGMGEIVEIPWEYLIKEVPVNWLPHFVEFIAKLMILFSIWSVKRCFIDKKNKKFVAFVRKIIPGILFGMICCLFFTVSGLQYTYDMTTNYRFHVFVFIVTSGGLFFAWLLGIMIFYVRDMNESLITANEQKDQMYLAEKEYYQLLLQREEDTRKFRHDLNNHLGSSRELVDEKNWKKLETYLDGLQIELGTIQKKKFETGNSILDALSLYLLAGVDSDVDVSINAHLEEKLIIDSVKLCTIYSNLLNNAVEEIERYPDTCGRYIAVEIWSDEDWLKLEIRNSLFENEKDLRKTSKKDTQNHGLGIRNVKEKVEEMEGMILFSQKPGEFCVEVTLPNRATI